MNEETLVGYPYIVVRIGCEACTRSGNFRLARLAAKFGAEIRLDELLKKLTADCSLQRSHHPYRGSCRARFVDLEPPMRPPDMPVTALRVVAGGRR